jgi:hypothetical protein|tara:strand:- start:406 stop:957 length:552 start_codon:yes stop_codon:yes gene_type:complete
LSFKSFKLVAETHGFLPNEKLVLMQLASFQNTETKQCNPSFERLAYYTGLSSDQTRRVVKILLKKNAIAKSAHGYSFNFPELSETQLVPIEWWPDDFAVEAITESFPKHHFDTKEAVNDFIKFCNDQGIFLAPERLNHSFIRNISSILSKRREGAVKIGSSGQNEQSSAISSFFPQNDTSQSA